jgi:F-type H+-transporting ATPase subunit delta
MSTQVVAKRYGQALFELAKEKDCLQSVQQDLQQILAVIADSTELQGVIANKLMQAEVKQRVFKQLFDNRINSISLNFLLLVLQ